MRTIAAFNGEFRWLSNFWPVSITCADGITYPSSEHAYMASKTLDMNIRREVATLKTAGDAKRFGRKIKLRADWEEVKRNEMLLVLRLKFQDPLLRIKLINTGDARLIEGNTWGDTYWGVCNGQGQNVLGQLLMLVRSELKP
jgi:ribA/ribD-fused uncharacterized protein